MDKQLEKESLEKYPKAWRHPTKAEQVAYFDPNEQKREAYIAGATSSSTVKNLEREVERLKGLIETGVKLAQTTSNLIQDIKGKPNDTRYSTHTKAALLALENWLNKKTENNL